jgi:hypothetical protein
VVVVGSVGGVGFWAGREAGDSDRFEGVLVWGEEQNFEVGLAALVPPKLEGPVCRDLFAAKASSKLDVLRELDAPAATRLLPPEGTFASRSVVASLLLKPSPLKILQHLGPSNSEFGFNPRGGESFS